VSLDLTGAAIEWVLTDAGGTAMTIWNPPSARNITVSLASNTNGCLQVRRCASSQMPSSERSKTLRSELFGFCANQKSHARYF
jgi:hypothetical protein